MGLFRAGLRFDGKMKMVIYGKEGGIATLEKEWIVAYT